MSDVSTLVPPPADLDRLPRGLQPHARLHRFEVEHATGAPGLLVHPDENFASADVEPAPTVLWFHGRTVNKMLDPGRYLRWKRLGIASCAIDLPGHGERLDDALQSAKSTLRVAEQQALEIPDILDQLGTLYGGAFDTSRIAIGGMSAGGMVTLIHLTSGDRWAAAMRCAVIEASAGDFTVMEGHDFFVPERVARLNPIDRIEQLADVPIFAVHSGIDAWVPIAGMRRFIEAARAHHEAAGRDPDRASLHAWPETGAPHEHMGFGRVTNDTKNLENAFIERHLLG